MKLSTLLSSFIINSIDVYTPQYVCLMTLPTVEGLILEDQDPRTPARKGLQAYLIINTKEKK